MAQADVATPGESHGLHRAKRLLHEAWVRQRVLYDARTKLGRVNCQQRTDLTTYCGGDEAPTPTIRVAIDEIVRITPSNRLNPRAFTWAPVRTWFVIRGWWVRVPQPGTKRKSSCLDERISRSSARDDREPLIVNQVTGTAHSRY
jgi:hypothetical protein